MAGSKTWQQRVWRRAGLHALGLGMDEYDKYLESEHWQGMRRQALAAQLQEHDHNFCVQCAAKTAQLHVHHLTYERLGKELLSDLTIICKPCHNKVHLRDAQGRTRNYAPGFR
jgi:5-methylcytosine-specific restriction endonuclease McrA